MPFPSTLPSSRVPDPMQAPPLRWGILGSGWIAEQFITSVRAHTRQQIAAIGSRGATRPRRLPGRMTFRTPMAATRIWLPMTALTSSMSPPPITCITGMSCWH